MSTIQSRGCPLSICQMEMRCNPQILIADQLLLVSLHIISRNFLLAPFLQKRLKLLMLSVMISSLFYSFLFFFPRAAVLLSEMWFRKFKHKWDMLQVVRHAKIGIPGEPGRPVGLPRTPKKDRKVDQILVVIIRLSSTPQRFYRRFRESRLRLTSNNNCIVGLPIQKTTVCSEYQIP